jgi:hypothetical protein
MINLFLSVAVFLNFVLYFTERIADNMTFLRKDFRNSIGNGLRSTLKRSCKCVLIINTLTNSNRSLDESHSDYQRTANFKNRIFRISRKYNNNRLMANHDN